MANLISQAERIPIAIFNGARGGTAISFHERNDANPLDLTTNYGRLLNRLELTNLTAAVRGILWYQGESDGSNTQAYYEDKFDALYQDWKVDYPNTEQFYPIQVRSGCGGGPPLMINIQEALRKQSSLKSDMKLMTTKGIATDGCHYPFINGYEELGNRMANVILNDLYLGAISDADAPDITEARTVSNDPSQIKLTISGADALFVDPSTISEFEIPNNTILSATVQGSNTIVLQLASPLTNSTVITYFDSSPTTTIGYIEDTAGIGLASFKDFPVLLFIDADNDGVADENDQCPGLDDALIGMLCDDGDPCTIGETYNVNCICSNGSFQDTDSDGVCDADDNDCILLNFEDFESGAEIWQTNGIDAALVQSTNSPSGDYSFRIRDNSGELASFSSDILDLSGNDQITVVFLYQTVLFSAGEDFFLEISTNGGLSFQEEKQWNNGVDFENNNIYHEEVELSNDKISQTSVFRFRCDGSVNADEVFIDNLKIDSCPTDCPSYYIDTNNLIVAQSISADLLIESNGTIETNSNIEFTAGQSILLMEGFEVKMGAVFHGYIQPCTN